MKIDSADTNVVQNFDMLAPAGFGEIIGGSMREDDHETLLKKIKEKTSTLPTTSGTWT